MLIKFNTVIAFAFLMLIGQGALAHEGRPVFVQIEELTQDAQSLVLNVRWKIPPVMPSGQEPLIHLSGADCKSIAGKNRPSLTGHMQYKCKADKPITVQIRYPQTNPVLSSLINLQKKSGESFSLFNGPDTLNILLPDRQDFLSVTQQYIQAGFSHILSGYDHLLFVLCLMQIAGGLRRLIWTITGFTLAHSVTLALSSLGIVNVRIDVVEVLIALSIVMLALEITRAKLGQAKDSLIWQYPALVASLFGLLHGLGFASALSDLGLPQNMKITALAFFNIGVELGQLAFIAVVLLLLKLAMCRFKLFTSEKKSPTIEGSLHFPTAILYLIGALSSYWFVDRSLALFI